MSHRYYRISEIGPVLPKEHSYGNWSDAESGAQVWYHAAQAINALLGNEDGVYSPSSFKHILSIQTKGRADYSGSFPVLHPANVRSVSVARTKDVLSDLQKEAQRRGYEDIEEWFYREDPEDEIGPFIDRRAKRVPVKWISTKPDNFVEDYYEPTKEDLEEAFGHPVDIFGNKTAINPSRVAQRFLRSLKESEAAMMVQVPAVQVQEVEEEEEEEIEKQSSYRACGINRRSDS